MLENIFSQACSTHDPGGGLLLKVLNVVKEGVCE